MQITTIGLDLAKSVFQVHGVDATGQVLVRKSLRRSQMLPFFAKLPPCLVGIEACGTARPRNRPHQADAKNVFRSRYLFAGAMGLSAATFSPALPALVGPGPLAP
jgi:hypothetical protein